MNLFVLRTWLQAKFTKDERGASMVEYILLVALIALAVIAAVVFLRGQVSRQVQRRRKQDQHATARNPTSYSALLRRDPSETSGLGRIPPILCASGGRD